MLKVAFIRAYLGVLPFVKRFKVLLDSNKHVLGETKNVVLIPT